MNRYFKFLKEKDTLLSAQNNRLTTCAQDMQALSGAASRGSGSGIDALLEAAKNELSLKLKFVYKATRGGVKSFLKGLGSTVFQLIDSLPDGKQDVLLQNTAGLLLELCFRMHDLIAL